ncbi:MAG TPA: hypothetical protein VJ860_17160 [Polyangia bacterium]|nr:hypothetical protein [Polyangia bacterium]
MNFSDYKGDAANANATGTSEVGEVAGSQLDCGPDSSVVPPDLVRAPDSLGLSSMDLPAQQPDLLATGPDLSPGSMDLTSPTDLVGQSRDLAQDLPSGGPDLMAPDAGPGLEAAADADGDAGILCGSGEPPLFTDSFDQYSSVIAGGWDTNSPSGSPVLLDQSTYLSRPASALASLPANSGAVVFGAFMSMSFGQTSHPSTAHLAFDVKIAKACLQSLPSGHYMTIGDVSPALQYLLSLCVEAGTLTTIYVCESAVLTGYPAAARQPIKLDEWQHIDLQAQFSGQQPTGSLSVGDGPAQFFTPHPNASASAGSGIGSVGIGTSLMGPALACTVNYDNVVFDRPAACAY